MAILYDDDFQSYALASNPPYGALGQYSGTSVIVNTPGGIFGDVKSVKNSAGKLCYPALPWAPGWSATSPFYQQFSIFFGLRIESIASLIGYGLLSFMSNQDQFNIIELLNLRIEEDGTLGFAQGPSNVATRFGNSGGFSLRAGAYYWFQVNVSFGTAGGTGFATCNAEVAVNGVSVMTAACNFGRTTAGLPGAWINGIYLGSAGQDCYIGRLTINTVMQPIGSDPHIGSPNVLIGQGIIEIIRALSLGAPVVINTCPVGTATEGVAYYGQLITVGGTPAYTWAISAGALPAGITLNVATGEVTGIATVHGLFSVTYIATDSLGVASAAKVCSLLVAPGGGGSGNPPIRPARTCVAQA